MEKEAKWGHCAISFNYLVAINSKPFIYKLYDSTGLLLLLDEHTRSLHYSELQITVEKFWPAVIYDY